MCFIPFKWAFDGPEPGTNWVLCGLLCGSHMSYQHGTQLVLATGFTMVPIELAYVWADVS